MSPGSPLTRQDLPSLHPIRDPRPLTLLPERLWSVAEWDRIRLGVRSGSMEERWILLAEGDVVFLHRSWTGLSIYEVTFSPTAGGRKITAAVVEGDREYYRASGDAREALLIEIVIDSVVFEEHRTDLWSAYQALPAETAE